MATRSLSLSLGLILGGTTIGFGCASGSGGEVVLDGRHSTSQSSIRLDPIDDESVLERAIGDYFGGKSVRFEYREQDGDGRLVVPFGAEGYHWVILIDTGVSTRDRSERVIRLTLDTDYVVSSPQSRGTLELINGYHAHYWAGTFYIDPNDDEVTGRWAINMPAVGVHPEVVLDAVQRLSAGWLELRDALEKTTIEAGYTL